MSDYIGLIHKSADSDFGVSFPDFPGCITAGRTLDEARDMAAEVLAFHIEGLEDEGGEIPAASSLEAVMSDPENRDGVAILVSAPSTRRERVNVVFLREFLERIDRFAASRGLNRSAFLARAALHEMEDRTP